MFSLAGSEPQLTKMVSGARSVSRRGALTATLALTLLCVANLGARAAPSTTATSPTEISSGKDAKTTLDKTHQSTKNGSQGNTVTNTYQNDDDQNLHIELNVLLTELREISDKIELIRKEHGQLAHGVSEISSAVKDMNERSEHIKKKVRKMSKTINKTTHHHKLKSSLKSLQKDHKRILEAVLNSTYLLRTHRIGNHTGFHHQHSGTKHPVKHPRICNNNTDPKFCVPAPDGDLKKHESIPESTTKMSTSVSEGDSDMEHKKSDDDDSSTEKDNMIPEPVVEPQGKTESSKKTARLPVDCTEVIQMGNMTSGVYRIKPKGLNEPIKVWCDHTTQGGGWTMMVARLQTDPQLDFNKNWEDYKKGFGDPSSEHWIGNDALHAMTKNRRHELRVNITNWENVTAWADWKDFSVLSEDRGYTLNVGRYASSSTAGDALKWHNGMQFSTPDRDNDALLGGQCARKNHGGWWYRGYRGCYQAHPTGKFQINPANIPEKADKRNFDLGPVLAWQNWRGESYFPKTLFLMFRPVMP